MAFSSTATTLLAGDTNGSADIFVKDRQTGAVTRVSVRTDGTQPTGDSVAPDVSSDGRYVTFASTAALVADDTNSCSRVSAPTCTDIYVHDPTTGVTSRISVATGGSQAGGVSGAPRISGDGRCVVFESRSRERTRASPRRPCPPRSPRPMPRRSWSSGRFWWPSPNWYEGATAANVTFDLGIEGHAASHFYPPWYACRVTVAVPAHGRYTTGLRDICPFATAPFPSLRIAGTVESDGPPLVVERSTYWSVGGQFWAAGASTLLTPLP